MTFTATPATPFTAGVSTIPATTANTWRANIAASLDTVGGGAYANVSVIDWSAGSAGWRFYAPLTVKSTGTLTLDAGATVTINADPSLFGTMRVGIGGAGGAVRFYATSTLTVDDTVAVSCAGDVTMTGASTLTHAALSAETHASTSSDTYSAGSVLAINTASATMGSDSVLTVNGTAGHVAQVICDTYSTTTFRTGAGVTCNSGSIFTIGAGCIFTGTIGGGGAAGALTFGATGTLTVPATCTTSLAIGVTGTLSTAAGASVVMSVGGGGTTGSVTFNANGTLETTASAQFNNGGTTTRTGAEFLSGTGAYTSLRVYNAPNGSYSVNPKHYERIIRSCASGATEILTLTPAPGASDYIEIHIIHVDNNTSTLTVKDAGGATIYSSSLTPGQISASQLIWNGSTWIPGLYSVR